MEGREGDRGERDGERYYRHHKTLFITIHHHRHRYTTTSTVTVTTSTVTVTTTIVTTTTTTILDLMQSLLLTRLHAGQLIGRHPLGKWLGFRVRDRQTPPG